MAMNDQRLASALVGRQSELGVLLAAVGAARQGRGSLAVLIGEPGVGKTRLATEAAGHAADASMEVVWAFGRQGRSAPLGPWRDALARVEVLLDELAGTTSDAEGLFAAATSAIEDVAGHRPLLLVLEDLQWFDDQSLKLLEWLRPAVAQLPVLVVATTRGPVDVLGRPDHLLRLGGLSTEEVGALVASHTTAEIDPAELCRRTGGNPLFVLEIAQQGLGGVPLTVADVVRQRLEGLSGPALTLVRAAAVQRAAATAAILSAVSGLQAAALDDAVDEATAQRFLVCDPQSGGLRFQHDIVEEAVYDSTDAALRRRLHAATAQALGSRGGEPAEVASHLVAAGAEASDDEVARWAEEAGRRALGLCAYREAARWYDDARRRQVAGSAAAIRLRLRAADARWRAGQRDEAWAAYETAAGEARSAGDAALLVEAALGFGGGRAGFEVSPTHEPQRRWLTAALDAVGLDDHALRALVLSRLSVTLSFDNDPARQRELATEAVEHARRSGDRQALVTALASFCDAHGSPEHVQLRLATAEEMVALASAERDPELDLLGLRFRIVALLEMGNRSAVDRAVQRFAELAHEIRQPAVSFFVPLFRCAIAYADGRQHDAERFHLEAAAIASGAEGDNGVILTTSQRFAMALEQGRAAEVAGSLLAVADQRPEISGPQAGVALVESYLGRSASARVRLAYLLADDIAAFPRDAEWLAVLACLAEAAVRSGDVDAATTLLPHLEAYGDLMAVDGIGAFVFGPASYFAGRLAHVAGDDDRAVRILRSARDAASRFRAPLLVAKTTWALAQAMAERDPDAAAELRSEVLAVVAELGLSGTHLWPPPADPAAASAVRGADSGPLAVMRADGEVWTLVWRGEETRLRASKGLGYLRELVARPGAEIHVLDLANPPDRNVRVDGDLGPVLDDVARAAYRRRVLELREEIDDAASRNDLGQAEQAEAELVQLIDQLAAATGLGGRARRPGSAAERARVNVTKSIKQAIDRIDEHLPALAHHLRTTVRTGTFCVYEPDPAQPPAWNLG